MISRPGSADAIDGPDRLRVLARLAAEAGSPALAADAEALAERVAEGRFHVVCVGQFKRGKSTLLNALIGDCVLPTGVAPITAAVTVVRHGERLAARVRFGERGWEACDPRGLAMFVSEEENPGNEKGVTGVEVFVPSPLLESGMCLVDTPGLGSVFSATAAATHAFVPHVDVALLVLGADPPISGDEVALVEEVAREAPELIVVLNKADRQPEAERAAAVRFTERVLAERLGRPVGPILQVSAAELLAGAGPTRDWGALVRALESLARDAGAQLVSAVEQRGVASLVDRLVRELDAQRAALLRPIEDSEARLSRLRRTVAEAQRSLEDLGYRLIAVEERLSRTLVEDRDRFVGRALPEAQRELRDALRGEQVTRAALRRRAVEHATEIAKRWLERWRREQEPVAETRYREAVARFVELVDAFQASLAPLGLDPAPRSHGDAGFRTRSGFHYTELLTVRPSTVADRLLDLFGPAARRVGAIERDGGKYLARLLEVNGARITNDCRDRVAGSRRILEAEIRGHLRELIASAERALDQARRARARGSSEVSARLRRIETLRSELADRRRPC